MASIDDRVGDKKDDKMERKDQSPERAQGTEKEVGKIDDGTEEKQAITEEKEGKESTGEAPEKEKSDKDAESKAEEQKPEDAKETDAQTDKTELADSKSENSDDSSAEAQESGELKKNGEVEGKDVHYPLANVWTFWFIHRAPGEKIVDYEASMTLMGSFSTVKEFWQAYSHLKRPGDLPTISDYHLFRKGVRPVWEDKANIKGGKWMIRVKKGLSSRLWERLILSIIGGQFDVGDEICGAVISIRNSEDIISLWNRTADDASINILIRDTLKQSLGIPPQTIMEYKAHNDSLRDNSSFRNTDVYN